MDYAACNVIYVDRNARGRRLVKRGDATMALMKSSSTLPAATSPPSRDPSAERHVYDNVEVLLENFSSVHLCNSGKYCTATLAEVDATCVLTLVPTLVFIDIPYNDSIDERAKEQSPDASPTSERFPVKEEDLYGLELLRWITSGIQGQSLSKLVVPIAFVAIPEPHDQKLSANASSKSRTDHLHRDKFRRNTPLDHSRMLRYLDVGAVDVLTSPFLRDRLPGLATHAYRAHKEMAKEQKALVEMKRGRKRSWVGLDDQKPYAYLREAMVSGLMDGICKLDGEDEDLPGRLKIALQLGRHEKVWSAIAVWHFSAHDFSDDELLHGATLMLQHALAMPELKNFRLTTENLTGFLVASRSAYNTFVPYHNFRHVVDVLQATFSFLVAIGSLPRFPTHASEPTETESRNQSPLAALIRPVDALTLMIAAIGHDVGHPGVNNAFLVNLNAPLAQLYNDRSVLEAFHCAAYSQILRRHWPAAFSDRDMRELMISSILATDMGLHFDYMKKLGYLQEKLAENGGTEGWNGRVLDEQKTLACSLIIKCADISNVARSFDVATQWTMILNEEWARQALMEQDLSIPSALLSPPVREMVDIGKGLLGFMNMIVIPLFQGVADVLPDMSTGLKQLQHNKATWEKRISEDQDKHRKFSDDSLLTDGVYSPRSLSVSTPPAQDVESSTRSGKTASFPAGLIRSRSEELADPVKIFVAGVPHTLREPDRRNSSNSGISPSHIVRENSGAFPSVSSISPDSMVNGHSSKSVLDSQDKVSYFKARRRSKFSNQDSDATLAARYSVKENGGVPRRGPLESGKSCIIKQSSSDTADGCNSVPGSGDGVSQATSATTNRLPCSPSTRNTSITSGESRDRLAAAGEKGSAPAYRKNRSCEAFFDVPSYNNHQKGRVGITPDRSMVSETSEDPSKPAHRTLRQKASLFRIPKFWHRKGSVDREAMGLGAGKEKGNDRSRRFSRS